MSKVNTNVEFYQGTVGNLFRIIRTPDKPMAHLLYIAPLFEQANQTRHHITRSAIHAYHRGIETYIFDHYGTGDSAGGLVETSLSIWQDDIVKQLDEIKSTSTKAIYLSLPLSAALLLSNEILEKVDGLMLIQPDFNGKRFIQQFKRLALVAEFKSSNKVYAADEGNKDDEVFEISGYQVTQMLLSRLAEQNMAKLEIFNLGNYWFEWQSNFDELSPARAKQQTQFIDKYPNTFITTIDDVKFWQATELQVSSILLTQEKLTFAQLISAQRGCKYE